MADDEMSDIVVVAERIGLDSIKELAERRFGDMVKAVVDVELALMALGGELHADEEAALVDRGSQQQHLWGINLYPEEYPEDDWIEFDSMINIRPAQGNRSRSVENEETQQRIRAVVARLIGDE